MGGTVDFKTALSMRLGVMKPSQVGGPCQLPSQPDWAQPRAARPQGISGTGSCSGMILHFKPQEQVVRACTGPSDLCMLVRESRQRLPHRGSTPAQTSPAGHHQ